MICPALRVTTVPNRRWRTSVAGREAEPGGQHPVVRGGGPAALEVAQDDAAGLDAGLLSRWPRR